MKLYSTVIEEGSAEQIIEKSKFIAYVKPVYDKQEADDYIAQIRKKHKDATHNVPAMVIGDKMQIQWASDDGEPQGTSGAPIIKMCITCEFDYTYLTKFQNMAGDYFLIENIKYTDKVEADFLCGPDDKDKVKNIIESMTSGKSRIKKEEMGLIKIKI